ncbi:MAG: cytochrome b N-terminal domain-containing protein [Acidobacteriota bacterium]
MEENKEKRGLISWLEKRINLFELFSIISSFGLFYSELDSKKPLKEAVKEVLEKRVPPYARWPQILGIITIILFFFQVLTGILLAFYYVPSLNESYNSVKFIIRDTHFGWFIHQIHYWGSNLLIIILIIRVIRFYYHGVYKSPRELLWIFGITLLVLSMVQAFFGNILIMDENKCWSSIRGIEIIRNIPGLNWAYLFLMGSYDINQQTIIRAYFFHISLLPLLFLIFLYLNISGIRKLGLSEIPWETKKRKEIPFYPHHFFNLLILLFIIFGILVTFSVLFPTPFYKPVDPSFTPPGILPGWFFLPIYGFFELFFKIIPKYILGLISVIIFFLILFLPFIDRKEVRIFKERIVAIFIGAIFLIMIGLFTFFGVHKEISIPLRNIF